MSEEKSRKPTKINSAGKQQPVNKESQYQPPVGGDDCSDIPRMDKIINRFTQGNKNNLHKKPKGAKLNKRQKAIAWADANRDAASSHPKGYSTVGGLRVGYEKEDNYASELTWGRPAENIHKGRLEK